MRKYLLNELINEEQRVNDKSAMKECDLWIGFYKCSWKVKIDQISMVRPIIYVDRMLRYGNFAVGPNILKIRCKSNWL